MGVIKSIYPDANNTLGRSGADIFVEVRTPGGLRAGRRAKGAAACGFWQASAEAVRVTAMCGCGDVGGAQAALRGGAIATLQLGKLQLNGPLWLVNGGNFAAIVRLPIYMQNSTLNETFGTDRNREW